MSAKHKGTKKRQPAWIQILFKRLPAGHALRTGFLLNLSRQRTLEEADSHPGGRKDLRDASLKALDDASDETLALALVLLSVVGLQDDQSRIEEFLDHPSDLVRRAARACRFQLSRLRR